MTSSFLVKLFVLIVVTEVAVAVVDYSFKRLNEKTYLQLVGTKTFANTNNLLAYTHDMFRRAPTVATDMDIIQSILDIDRQIADFKRRILELRLEPVTSTHYQVVRQKILEFAMGYKRFATRPRTPDEENTYQMFEKKIVPGLLQNLYRLAEFMEDPSIEIDARFLALPDQIPEV